MIKSGEAHARRARDIAHRGRVIALLGKNARRGPQDQFELLIVARKISFQFNDYLLHWERGRPARNPGSALPSKAGGTPALPVFCAPSQSHIFKLEWLAFDSRRRRRDPVGNSAGFGYCFHQTAHIFAVFDRWQPIGLSSLE